MIERELRKHALKNAKSVLYRSDSSESDIAEAIGLLPGTGHKAMALRLRLEARQAGRAWGWDDI